jgi:hypothetical protein
MKNMTKILQILKRKKTKLLNVYDKFPVGRHNIEGFCFIPTFISLIFKPDFG